jgi:hypothetical protein
MHGPINVKSPNNTSKWQMGFNSAFKGLIFMPIDQGKMSDNSCVVLVAVTSVTAVLCYMAISKCRLLAVNNFTV